MKFKIVDDPLGATDPDGHMLCANVCGSLAFISSC
jgi:hypothetical protein